MTLTSNLFPAAVFGLPLNIDYNGFVAQEQLIQLARELEWLGCELEFCGHEHAMEGFPQRGPKWNTFLERQQGVLRTADKVERELKNAVRFNPRAFVEVDFSVDAALNSVTNLLAAVEDIKQAAVFAVHELPVKVRNFTEMVETYTGADNVT